jgi:adenylate cyclase
MLTKNKIESTSLEIERKYRVDLDFVDLSVLEKIDIKQGYISNTPDGVVRVRTANDTAFLTVKSKVQGISRAEYEYEIPLKDALNMILLFCDTCISKTRYIYPYRGKNWEIDVFHGDNEGLCIAEIEMTAEDEFIENPTFLLFEVSHDPRYFNNNLLKNPYNKW